MTITICICTRNRAASLARTLESLCGSDVPEGIDLDVVVVDNGSTDGTAEVAKGFAGRLKIEVVPEPRTGLSHARNRALDVATGDWIYWLDDDATVGPRGFVEIEEGLSRFPGADFAGGPIIARFEGKDEKWVAAVEASVGGAFAWYEPGTAESEVRSEVGPLPWGANMMIRRSAVGDLRFDTDLGRQPGRIVVSGEETTFCRDLLERGSHGCWLPGMRVDHHIGPERTNTTWIHDYFYGHGWKDALRWPADDDEGFRGELRRRGEALRRHDAWRRRLRRCFASFESRLADLRRGAGLRGFLAGARESSRVGIEEELS